MKGPSVELFENSRSHSNIKHDIHAIIADEPSDNLFRGLVEGYLLHFFELWSTQGSDSVVSLISCLHKTAVGFTAFELVS